MKVLTINESGYSLVGLMVAGAVGSIILTGLVGMMNQLSKANLDQQQQAEIIYFQSEIYASLRNQNTCLASFSAYHVNDMGGTYSTPQSLVRQDGVALYQTGQFYSNHKLQIQQIQLGDFQADDPSTPDSGKAVLHITIGKPGQPLGPQSVLRDIKLQATRDPATKNVTSCVAIGGTTKEIWTLNPDGSIYYNGGNIGIGTANPQTMLDVAGGIRPGSNGISIGGNCQPEGTMAYDMNVHSPVFCNNNGKWAKAGGVASCQVVSAVGTRVSCGSVVSVSCPSGTTLTGGGADAGGNATLQTSKPQSNGWYAAEYDGFTSGCNGLSNLITAYAICCQ